MYSSLKTIETVTIRYLYLDQFGCLNILLWSDGCSTQFQSWFVFQLMTLFPSRVNTIRYYNQRPHGTGSTDDIGVFIKSAIYRAVMVEKIVIHTPLDFTKSAWKLVKGIECVYLPNKTVMIQPDEVKNARTAPYS